MTATNSQSDQNEREVTHLLLSDLNRLAKPCENEDPTVAKRHRKLVGELVKERLKKGLDRIQEPTSAKEYFAVGASIFVIVTFTMLLYTMGVR